MTHYEFEPGAKRGRNNVVGAWTETPATPSRRGETKLDLLMSTVLPIVGGITAGMLLRSFTSLPFWACLLIGIPVGTVAAWVLFVGIALLIHKAIAEPLAAKRERRTQRTRDRFKDS